MKTVTFVYTDNVTYKATNVISVDNHGDTIEYVQDSTNADGSIAGLNMRSVDTYDLLYAVVKDVDTKEVTIIPGLFDSFDVVPKGAAVQRQANIEAEAARVAADRAAKAPAREAKEKAKYEARRAARKAEWVGQEEDTEVADATEATPVAAKTEDNSVFGQLAAAGISERDLAVLREVLK